MTVVLICLIQNNPDVLQFEADRRAFIITINSFGTELTKEDRAKLYPRCGELYPYGLQLLAKADDFDQVRQVADIYGVSVAVIVVFLEGRGCIAVHHDIL